MGERGRSKRFLAHPGRFWTLLVACGMAVAVLGVMAGRLGSMPFGRAALVTVGCILPIAFTATMGRSMMCTVTIDAQGVQARAFGITQGRLGWDEMAEVGVGTQGGPMRHRYFLYFVRYHLTEQQRFMIGQMKQNDSAIWVQLNKDVLDAVMAHYSREIRHLALF